MVGKYDPNQVARQYERRVSLMLIGHPYKSIGLRSRYKVRVDDSKFHPRDLRGRRIFVLPNHQHIDDTIIINEMLLRLLGNPGNFMIRNTYEPQWLMQMLGAFPIMADYDYERMIEEAGNDETKLEEVKAQRADSVKKGLKHCVSVAHEGEPIVIYPEGERRWQRPFKPISSHFRFPLIVQEMYNRTFKPSEPFLMWPWHLRYRVPETGRGELLITLGGPEEFNDLERLVAYTEKELDLPVT